MILVVGLGNPGQKFEKTRHNLGFWVLDEFVREYNFPGFKFSKKFNSEISEGFLNEEKIILAKPQTFMNNSGKAVKKLIENWKIKSEKLFVIHDDIDLNLGEIKVVKNRGAAGHKGVKSIIDALGTKNFIRVRIGIENQESRIGNIEKFVLKKFNRDEKKVVDKVIKEAIEAIAMILKDGLEKAMSEHNK
jgi:PTH1 family peptidyl-tRNA hydrolase